MFIIILVITKCLHGFHHCSTMSEFHVVLFPRANSVTWNPHKMMGVPLQCSALLVREEVCPNILKFPIFSDILLLKIMDVFFTALS